MSRSLGIIRLIGRWHVDSPQSLGFIGRFIGPLAELPNGSVFSRIAESHKSRREKRVHPRTGWSVAFTFTLTRALGRGASAQPGHCARLVSRKQKGMKRLDSALLFLASRRGWRPGHAGLREHRSVRPPAAPDDARSAGLWRLFTFSLVAI